MMEEESKAARVRELRRQYPDWTNAMIAMKAKCREEYVRAVLHREKTPPKTERRQGVVLSSILTVHLPKETIDWVKENAKKENKPASRWLREFILAKQKTAA